MYLILKTDIIKFDKYFILCFLFIEIVNIHLILYNVLLLNKFIAYNYDYSTLLYVNKKGEFYELICQNCFQCYPT